MFKRTILVLALLTLLTSNCVFASNSYFNLEDIDEGVVRINYDNPENKHIKVMIQRDGERSFYDLGQFNQYPLTFGNGDYTLVILEQVYGTRYRGIAATRCTLSLDDTTVVYLKQSQMLNWNEDIEPIKKAAELVEGLSTNEEKALAIHTYIVNNFRYDFDKANAIDNIYVPDPEVTFENGSGICSDFANLYAIMMRSVGVPTRFVKGYKNDIATYHAWNQVYLDDEDRWITVDLTYDIALHSNNTEYSFKKDSTQYTIRGHY